jgi:hypothetical protein
MGLIGTLHDGAPLLRDGDRYPTIKMVSSAQRRHLAASLMMVSTTGAFQIGAGELSIGLYLS